MNTTQSLLSILAAATAALALSQPAAALDNSNLRFDTAKDLYAVCSTPATAAEYPITHQACRAFIESAIQYHDLVSKPKQMKRLVCYPANATIEDGVAAFNAWAVTKAADVQLMGEPPVTALIRALAAKYPCKG